MIVGDISSGVTRVSHAFIWRESTGYQILGEVPGNPISLAIDNSGTIVGDTYINGVENGFSWQAGTVRLWPRLIPSRILENGQFAGHGLLWVGGEPQHLRDNLIVSPRNWTGDVYVLAENGNLLAIGTANDNPKTTVYELKLLQSKYRAIRLHGEAFDVIDSGLCAGVSQFHVTKRPFYTYIASLLSESGDQILPDYHLGSGANSLNDFGMAVGEINLSRDTWHACFWRGGVLTDIGDLGGPTAAAGRVNNAGLIAGESELTELVGAYHKRHAFLYSNGVMRDLGEPAGLPFTILSDMDQQGKLLCRGYPAAYTYPRAFFWTEQAGFEEIVTGSRYTNALGMNDQGLVVGQVAEGPFVWQNGQTAILPGPP